MIPTINNSLKLEMTDNLIVTMIVFVVQVQRLQLKVYIDYFFHVLS